jgi:hypothetical protein
VDGDFGPPPEGSTDESGATSLYGNPPILPGGSTGSQYPKPEQIKWIRPLYADKDAIDIISDADGTADDLLLNSSDPSNNDATNSQFNSSSLTAVPDSWCTCGQLFKGGTSSGDVVQGMLGDCWFLGALAVVARNEKLLSACFWPPNQPDRCPICYVVVFAYVNKCVLCLFIQGVELYMTTTN